jgi:hypothetical protein
MSNQTDKKIIFNKMDFFVLKPRRDKNLLKIFFLIRDKMGLTDV